MLFALVVAGSLLVQVGTNLTDEYADHRRTGDAGKFPAPHKVIARGLLSERAVLAGLITVFAVATAIGLYIAWEVGWPILVVGAASGLAAFLYSAGPFPLGDLGLGEVLVFTFMGPVMVMGAYYVQAGEVTGNALVISLPMALLVTAILHANNMRDMDEDRVQGKHTISAGLGIPKSKVLYVAMLAAAFGLVIVAGTSDIAHSLVLVALLPVPWALRNIHHLHGATDRPALMRVMVNTSTLHGFTGFLMAAGLALGEVL
jgi:1,4-dihydroxy-2-naphthoate octaprenyltransferase